MSHQIIETLGDSEELTIDIFNDDLFEDIFYNSEEDDDEENEEVDEEYDEHNEEEDHYIPIPTTRSPQTQLTPCVVMVNRNGTIQRCGEMNIKNPKKIWNLIGAWEVDTQAADAVGEEIDRLGICTTHFHYDQNDLHSEGLKQ